MTNWRTIASIFIVVIIQGNTANGQQTTERYIPVGQSPGISAARSVIGKITDLDYESYAMNVAAGKHTTTVTMTPETIYYVDRSHMKRTNSIGSFDDCAVGQQVEVNLGPDGKVDWVKIRPGE